MHVDIREFLNHKYDDKSREEEKAFFDQVFGLAGRKST